MIGAFLVGAVGNAVPYLVLNWRDPGNGGQMGLALALAGVVYLGVVVAPVLGMVAWRFDRTWRGLVAMWAGFAVGGVVGFQPVFLRGAADPNYDSVWSAIAFVVVPAAVLATVGWCLIGMVAAFRSRRWTARAGASDE